MSNWTSNDHKQVRNFFELPAVRFRFKRPRPFEPDADPIEWHLRQNRYSYFVGSESAARKALSDVLSLGGRCADLYEQGAGV